MSLETSKNLTVDGWKSTALSRSLANIYSPTQFCETYNPDLQSRLMAVKSIAELSMIDSCPNLGDVSIAYGIEGAREWIKCHLLKVNEFVGVKQKLTDVQLYDLSDQMACEYSFLNIAEMCCFFGRLRSGKYEDFYGSVDPMRILKSLDSFCRDRRSDMERFEREEELKQRARKIETRTANAITLEEYLKNRNGTMKVTIYWVNKKIEVQKRIRERFGIGDYTTVNGETPAEIKDEDVELLRETERRGFIQLRFKPE